MPDRGENEGRRLLRRLYAKGFAGYGENRGHCRVLVHMAGWRHDQACEAQKIGGAVPATIDEPETGPRFGSDGLTIRVEPGQERLANSKLGPYYEAMPGGGRSVFAPQRGDKGDRFSRDRAHDAPHVRRRMAGRRSLTTVPFRLRSS